MGEGVRTTDRRGFLQTTAAMLGGMVVGGVVRPRSGYTQNRSGYTQNQEVNWDREVDVVAVGAGAAGTSAAFKAASLGNQTLILEKGPTFGGTAIKSGGILWIPNNLVMRGAGMADPKEDAIRYMVRTAYPELYNAKALLFGIPEREYRLIEDYYDRGFAVHEEYSRANALDSTFWAALDGSGPLPDYYSDLPENKSPRGRSIAPVAIRARTWTIMGGVPDGYDLMLRLHQAAMGQGAEILYNHRVSQILRNTRGEVVGVQADFKGRPVFVKARKGLIFGSGGFTFNDELVRNYLKGPIFGGCNLTTCEGDFITMALDTGADLGNMNNAWWAQLVVENRSESTKGVFAGVFMAPGDSMVMVNRYGRRVVNEKQTYNERTQAHFEWDPVRGEYPNLILFMLFDQRTLKLFGVPEKSPGLTMAAIPSEEQLPEARYVIQGATLDGLTNNIQARILELIDQGVLPSTYSLDPNFTQTLRSSIERFNTFAQAGVDQDFHRGESQIDLAFNGPAGPGNSYPNPTMYPIATGGPYYAIILGAGTLGTKGGPKTNPKAQVLDARGKPIPGLYGAGNCIASPAAAGYWGAGGTIGPAVVYGAIAAENAHLEPIKD